MRSAITVILGIILLWAAFSGRKRNFLRIRGISLIGIAGLVMRVLYAAAGTVIILYAFREKLL